MSAAADAAPCGGPGPSRPQPPQSFRGLSCTRLTGAPCVGVAWAAARLTRIASTANRQRHAYRGLAPTPSLAKPAPQRWATWSLTAGARTRMSTDGRWRLEVLDPGILADLAPTRNHLRRSRIAGPGTHLLVDAEASAAWSIVSGNGRISRWLRDGCLQGRSGADRQTEGPGLTFLVIPLTVGVSASP